MLREIATTSHTLRLGTVDYGPIETRIGLEANNMTPLDYPHDSSVFPSPNQALSSLDIGPRADNPCMSMLPRTPDSLPEPTALECLLENEGLAIDENTKQRLTRSGLTLEEILQAGFDALTHDTSLSRNCSPTSTATNAHSSEPKLRTDKLLVLQNNPGVYSTFLPDMHRNHLRLKQVVYITACFANAASLGYVMPDDVDCDEDRSSPFFRPAISVSAAEQAILTDFRDVKPCLRPSVSQIMHDHHPYIDVLPFPKLRDRIIKLTCGSEPMMDDEELCHDLANDGLVCWGSSLGGGSAAVGSGAPWDVRSWEAQPWFLKKWWILIGGVEGEIYAQTKWWCEMRGEKFCGPW